MMSIRILDHGVSVEVNGERVALTCEDGWLAVALGLSRPDGVPAKAVQLALRGECCTDGGAGLLARFQSVTGLTVESRGSDPDTVYHLNRDVWVDALRYLELVDVIRYDPSGDHQAAIYEAQSIWRSGPPDLGDLANPAPDVYQRLNRAHAYLQSLRKRILIVDDQVGDLLAERLGRHDCRVAHDMKEFNSLRGELHQFDLAVVDLHMTTSYADATGDVIVRDINAQGLTLPVIMITLSPPRNRSVQEWIKSLGLVDVVYKEKDEPGANMAFVAERVNALLLENPVERACEQIAQRVHSLRRKARTRLAAKFSGPAYDNEVESMEAHADAITRLAGELKLADARMEVKRFVDSWGE